uniref:Uncharacterized protein n=1 Tax=Glossina palpalis gambiensis TaxID=67801 RepID=A0A1B0BSU9_9MUSC
MKYSLFLPWHYTWAERIKQAHTGWNDENIFQKVLRYVIAKWYLPAFSAFEIMPYEGYNSSIRAGTSRQLSKREYPIEFLEIPDCDRNIDEAFTDNGDISDSDDNDRKKHYSLNNN